MTYYRKGWFVPRHYMSLCSPIGPKLSVTSRVSSHGDGRVETVTMRRGCFEIGEGREGVCIVKWLFLPFRLLELTEIKVGDI